MFIWLDRLLERVTLTITCIGCCTLTEHRSHTDDWLHFQIEIGSTISASEFVRQAPISHILSPRISAEMIHRLPTDEIDILPTIKMQPFAGPFMKLRFGWGQRQSTCFFFLFLVYFFACSFSVSLDSREQWKLNEWTPRLHRQTKNKKKNSN